MPFILIILGAILFISAIRGTTGTLASLLYSDLTGKNSFLYWAVAIMVIGGVGYIKPLKTLSDSFLLLLVVVLFIHNKGFFAQFSTALQNVAKGSTTVTSPNSGAGALGGLGGLGGGGSGGNALMSGLLGSFGGGGGTDAAAGAGIFTA